MMGAFSIRGKLLISGDLVDGALVIENGSITGIERLPGGAQLPQSVIEAFRRLAAQLPATGVTGFLPTVVSSPPEFYPPIFEAFDAARAAPGAQVPVEELHPDVVVMDMAMPNMNGAEATRQIKRRFPEVRVLILTMHENEQCLAQIVNAGAIGCVVKCSAGTELVTAVRAAARGESYFSPTMATMMLEGYRSHLAAEGRDECDLLTEREREILQMEAEGKTNQEIADSLVVSIKTVQTHRAHMMEKLEAHDRTELVKHAIRLGMITTH